MIGIQLFYEGFRIKALNNPAFFSLDQRRANSGQTDLVFLQPAKSCTDNLAYIIVTPSRDIRPNKFFIMRA